jgi:YjjG family noncanonical pyrimidine nucleotidase
MKTKNYTCVFFDLDHTLWDYETNSRETLYDLYHDRDLEGKGVWSFDRFFDEFRRVNLELWDQYDAGLIDSQVIRRERFIKIFAAFSIKDALLSEQISHAYLSTCPTKGNLMPHAMDVLNYLKEKYILTIITNGFEEIQSTKIASSQITPYFNHVITSQKAGARKPSKSIFDYALQLNGATCHQAIMIGDNVVADIGGARAASIDAVFFNPESNAHDHDATHEITSLDQLLNIL